MMMKVSFMVPILGLMTAIGLSVLSIVVLGYRISLSVVSLLTVSTFLSGMVFLNWIVKKTPWYITRFLDWEHERYPTEEWQRKHSEREFDVVNLGSSIGHWGFDYAGLPIKGLNWARMPQSLQNDFRLLQTHYKILKKGAYVLITISPLLGLFVPPCLPGTYAYLDVVDDSYHDKLFLKKAKLLKFFPFLFGLISVKAVLLWLVRGMPCPESSCKDARYSICINPMSEDQLRDDASKWVNDWLKEFSMNSFSDKITKENEANRLIQAQTMRELVDFCLAKGLEPVYVIPPVTDFLSCYFTASFRSQYFYEFLDLVGRNIRLLDYMDRVDLKDKKLYFNSFFFNKTGRTLFTRTVLSDVGAIN